MSAENNLKPCKPSLPHTLTHKSQKHGKVPKGNFFYDDKEERSMKIKSKKINFNQIYCRKKLMKRKKKEATEAGGERKAATLYCRL
jgi:hypothetical protein